VEGVSEWVVIVLLALALGVVVVVVGPGTASRWHHVSLIWYLWCMCSQANFFNQREQGPRGTHICLSELRVTSMHHHYNSYVII
jgi:hypothetical protein